MLAKTLMISVLFDTLSLNNILLTKHILLKGD